MQYVRNSNFFSVIVAFLLCCAHVQGAGFDPFQFLPETSRIKQECLKCGSGYPLFRTTKQQGCKYIQETLAKFNEPDPEPGFLDVLFGLFVGPNGVDLVAELGRQGNESTMKQNVFAVLGETCSPEEMRQEHRLVYETAKQIRATRAERKMQQKTSEPRAPQDPY
jgi:hypothetical protein